MIPPQPADGAERPTPAWVAALVAMIFLATVAFGASHHEMWRDEVRALSIATAGSFTQIFHDLHNEGHPALWYVLLHIASILGGGSRLALPVTSALVATVAVWLFVRYARFTLWQRVLFAFGFFPAYHYAVMSRNYGLGMLVLFAYCALGRRRHERPLLGGTLLALLANTSVHAMVLAGALLLAWVLGAWSIRRRSVGIAGRRIVAGMSIAVLGGAICVRQTMPDRTSSVVQAQTSAPGIGVRKAARALANPGRVFIDAFGRDAVPVALGGRWRDLIPVTAGNLTIVLAAVILLEAPALLAAHLAALVGLTTLFAAVYPGGPRHQGLEYLCIVALLWLWRADRPARATGPDWRGRLASGLVTVLFTMQLAAAARAFRDDATEPMSAAPALGRWLGETEAYRNAILIAEPDYLLETLPYYAPNRTYQLRAGRFVRWIRFTTDSPRDLTLAELAQGAQRLQAREHAPVLILFSAWARLADSAATVPLAFGQRLRWNAADRARFLANVHEVARFTHASTDERYVVYALTTKP